VKTSIANFSGIRQEFSQIVDANRRVKSVNNTAVFDNIYIILYI
jgi:hypothetical protein